ncbi:MAG TPA: methyltransferase domain-containing protein [Chthoniobacterales bacterium]|nr:methyltransferase domain-containing protein [Chthoniobacterales bacterium]
MQVAEYETMFRVEETHWWYRALHQLIFQTLEAELPDWRNKAILDAGCGTGAILQRLGNPGKNAGVDLAPEAIAFCRERGLNNAQQGNILALPFVDASFDAVISSSVLYHAWVGDVAAAVREMRRVLRPNGLLIINVPAFRFLHSAHDDAVMTARRFRKPELRKLLRDQNFTINRLTYWTSLLFPLAVVARTLGVSQMGRDFEAKELSFSQRVFAQVMSLELRLLRGGSFPFGVALLATARK